MVELKIKSILTTVNFVYRISDLLSVTPTT